MQARKALFLAMAVILLSSSVAASNVFAETDQTASLEKAFAESLVAAAAVGGTGAFAGLIMSVGTVAGKNLKAAMKNLKNPAAPTKGEAVDIAQLLITVAIGGAIGAILPSLGISAEAALGFDFMALALVNWFIRPIFSNFTLKKSG